MQGGKWDSRIGWVVVVMKMMLGIRTCSSSVGYWFRYANDRRWSLVVVDRQSELEGVVGRGVCLGMVYELERERKVGTEWKMATRGY